MTSASVARGLERLWYGRSPFAALLQPLAWLFAFVTGLRRLAYAKGWLRAARVGVPVIVVGNITTGGTGKTPLVAWLVQRLRAQGCHPVIVSRGYGGRRHARPVRVTAASTAAEVGDEPLLLARRTGVPVVVGAQRAAAARLAVEAGADVIVADDGLQHYALARDLEVVVLDGERRLGNERLLPAGPLREPRSRLASVGLVMLNGGDARAGEIGFRLRPTGVIALRGEQRRDLASFAGQRVQAVAGIGNPGRFLAGLRDHGLQPVAVAVADHGRVDLAALRRAGEWPILMTEKDAIKYTDTNVADAWYVPVEVEMSPEAEAAIMTRVQEAMRAASAGAPVKGIMHAKP